MNQVSRTVRRFTVIGSLIVAVGLGSAAPALGSIAQDPPRAEATKQKPAVGTVNINTATAAELQKLPGVGPATATRIIEYRQKNGGFKKIEDLMNIRGIGEKSFLKLKPLVTIAPPKVFGL